MPIKMMIKHLLAVAGVAICASVSGLAQAATLDLLVLYDNYSNNYLVVIHKQR